MSKQPQYLQVWIVVDRDEVKDFDKTMKEFESNNMDVGWSNPCFEIWLHAYFGLMPYYNSSADCCSGFAKEYKKFTKKCYLKNNSEIYKKLIIYGNEEEAIRIACTRLEQTQKNECKPSKMNSTTTVYKLVEEIRKKIHRK